MKTHAARFAAGRGLSIDALEIELSPTLSLMVMEDRYAETGLCGMEASSNDPRATRLDDLHPTARRIHDRLELLPDGAIIVKYARVRA